MKFSRRFTWEARPNALSQERAALEASDRHLVDLTVSNPTRTGIEYPPDLLVSLSDPRALRYEPDAAGLLAAREAVVEYYSDHGATVHPDQVLLTASTSEAYHYLFKLMADPGDEVLVPRPSYPLFEFLAGMELLETVAYPVHAPDPCNLATERTRALITVHPNNPTGDYLSASRIRQLSHRCEGLGMGLIADEVFLDYRLDGAAVETMAKAGSAFVLSGLSKVCGLPQMKLGWMVLPADPEVRRRLELIADTYLSVSAPVQWAGIDWLRQRHLIQSAILGRVRANSALLERLLAGTEFVYQPPEGGWTAVVELPRTLDEEVLVLRLLRDFAVLMQPGYFYDFNPRPRVVVSLLARPEELEFGIERLKMS